jgi:NTP pyrophosphatase (non-canonical NTP hydrolase)
MTNLESQIASWHENNFGKTVRLPETYRKLLEEVGELGQALLKSDTDNIAEECGDCALILSHIIRGACPDRPSLMLAMDMSLNKCETERHKQKRLHKSAQAALASEPQPK